MIRTKPWDTGAACKTADASLLKKFYSNRKKDIAQAKALCQQCPVKTACYLNALRNSEPAGIWGGVQFDISQAIIEPATPIISPTTYVPVSVPERIIELRKESNVGETRSLLPEVVSAYIEKQNRPRSESLQSEEGSTRSAQASQASCSEASRSHAVP